MICKNTKCEFYLKKGCDLFKNHKDMCKDFIPEKKDNFYYVISIPVDTEVFITIDEKKYPMGIFHDLCRDGKINAKCRIDNL